MAGSQRRVERRPTGDLLVFPARRRLLGYAFVGLVFTASVLQPGRSILASEDHSAIPLAELKADIRGPVTPVTGRS